MVVSPVHILQILQIVPVGDEVRRFGTSQGRCFVLPARRPGGPGGRVHHRPVGSGAQWSRWSKQMADSW